MARVGSAGFSVVRSASPNRSPAAPAVGRTAALPGRSKVPGTERRSPGPAGSADSVDVAAVDFTDFADSAEFVHCASSAAADSADSADSG